LENPNDEKVKAFSSTRSKEAAEHIFSCTKGEPILLIPLANGGTQRLQSLTI